MFSNLKKLILCTMAASPALVLAFSTGPPSARTNVAADGGLNCTACHRSNPLNAGSGKVSVVANSYTPGVKQTVTVRVEHPDALRWGFQLTARPEADQSKPAGAFTPNDNIRVRCGLLGVTAPDAPCPASDVQFASHRLAPNTNTPAGGRTFEIEWTPPETNVGAIIFYAVGNAANNDGTNNGDFIYSNTIVISPNSPGGPPPAISAGGVVDAFNFSAANGIATNSWVALFGTNLSTATRTWDDAIVAGVRPTSLSGLSVKINNKPAPVYYVSPTQVSVLAPLDDATGDVSVVVTTANGESAPATIKRVAASPAIVAPFSQNGRQYAIGVALDGTFVGKVGTGSAATRAARPGEIISIFGSGFGATSPQLGTDKVITGAPELVTKPTIRLGDATLEFAGNGNLIFAGVYQFNITVPATAVTGDLPLVATAGGVSSLNTVFLSVAP